MSPDIQNRSTLQGTIQTGEEKNIDSNVPTGMGYVIVPRRVILHYINIYIYTETVSSLFLNFLQKFQSSLYSPPKRNYFHPDQHAISKKNMSLATLLRLRHLSKEFTATGCVVSGVSTSATKGCDGLGMEGWA